MMEPLSAECPNLFVYGTLRRGATNERAAALARESEFVGTGKIRGRLYLIDWYPGVIQAAGPQDWVIGDIYQIHDSSDLLHKLDDYEGSEFERVVATAYLANASALPCWLFLYRGQPHEEKRITSGEFIAG